MLAAIDHAERRPLQTNYLAKDVDQPAHQVAVTDPQPGQLADSQAVVAKMVTTSPGRKDVSAAMRSRGQ